MAGKFNGFKGKAKRLDDYDLPRVGSKIGVGEDEIHAFMEVEARGSGFDNQGRPAMLFEPHLFWRELGNTDNRKRAAVQGLAYKDWVSGKYPKDSYPRLMAAIAIDETAALRSASWGLGQILGSNYKAAGFSSPQAMVLAFMDDEEAQLESIVKFLIANKLDDDLRRHSWFTLAAGYNGPAHAKHNYAGRLAAAFEKWKKIKDTPWTPDMAANETKQNDPVLADVIPEPAKPEPIEAEPEDTADKPFVKSKTLWATIIDKLQLAVAPILGALAGIDWKTVLALSVLISVAFGLFVIRERWLKHVRFGI